MGKGSTGIIAAVLLFLAIPLVAIADLVSGSSLGFSPFYAAPVALVAWQLGRGPGIASAVISGAAWSFADHVNRPDLELSAATWNDSVRVLGLVALAYLLAVVRRSQSDLQLALSQRDEFLSLVAHELRAPVAAIEIVATGLARSASATDEGRPLRQLVQQSRHLRALAEDILAIGRLEAGVERTARETFDVCGLVREVAERDERVSLDASSLAVSVNADRQQIWRALSNVVDNALKFSSDVVALSVGSADGSALIRVTDHGIGLDSADIVGLFQKYGRSDDPAVRRTPGVGLGLYLARLSVEANGGTIEATSPGRRKGATFIVRLPIATGHVAAPRPVQADPRA